MNLTPILLTVQKRLAVRSQNRQQNTIGGIESDNTSFRGMKARLKALRTTKTVEATTERALKAGTPT